MSSINPNNINGAYPIAGQDNDSQGFRDNFTNIKNNLTFAKTEMEDLQSNALLKSALAGTTVSNEMAGTILGGAQLARTTRDVSDLTTLSGTIAISWATAYFQYFTTTGAVSLTFSNWGTGGQYSTMRLLIDVVNIAHTITIPAAVNAGRNTINGLLGNVITPSAIGKYMYEFSTYDAGTSIIIVPLIQ